MIRHIVETSYPIDFRQKDAMALGEQIRNRHSVVLIGMKRVGISNFLRFFLYNREIKREYLNDSKKHLFIPIDLNDLIEREVFPFWILTQKRILDSVEENNIETNIIRQIEDLFLTSIQSQDLFLTIDSIRKSLILLIQEGYLPTLFFLRFDRMQDSITSGFFHNLQGLVTSTNHNVSYVFTSVRDLASLAPDAFTKSQANAFAYNIYVKPGSTRDSEIIYSAMNKNYKLHLSNNLKEELLRAADGYAQYLFYSLIFLLERKSNLPHANELLSLLLENERIILQSEELWESLTDFEQEFLIKIQGGEKISKEEKKKGEYLFKTGIASEREGIFSPLFSFFVREKVRERENQSDNIELTRKENMLLTLLLSQRGNVCERELIIKTVWPETESIGVSDWAIDRLVARLRNKLKMQSAKYEIVTIKTRGYKLTD